MFLTARWQRIDFVVMAAGVRGYTRITFSKRICLLFIVFKSSIKIRYGTVLRDVYSVYSVEML